MGIFRSLTGAVEAELTSADPGTSLQRIADAGIRLYCVQQSGPLTCSFRISRRDWKKVLQLTRKMGDSLSLRRRIGVYWTVKDLKKRPVLVTGMALLMFLALYLPGRICFVQVDGNASIPARLIIEKAEDCGICFGASRREVRSEKIKNALLSAIPQLQWAGVNTRGCVAVISVREKTASESKLSEPAVSRIVASRDGVIVSCTVEQGNGVCKVGQAVKAGDLLISGYTDCGIAIRAVRSVGEVYGQTSRHLDVILPENFTFRTAETVTEKKYALIIGKKRINFYKDSGILGGTCGKMSTVNYMTLPGGFSLPIALVTEQRIQYETQRAAMTEERGREVLSGFGDDYLQQQMLAGRVLRKSLEFGEEDGVFRMHGDYSCIEMIGREQIEENLANYGKSD